MGSQLITVMKSLRNYAVAAILTQKRDFLLAQKVRSQGGCDAV